MVRKRHEIEAGMTAAEIVWMRATHMMLFPKQYKQSRAYCNPLVELMTPRWTGPDDDPPPIPDGQFPWEPL